MPASTAPSPSSGAPGPPVSPKAPWHSEMAASNSPSKARARASARSNVAPGGARRRVARSTNRWLMSTPSDLDAPRGRARGRGGPGRSRRRAPACPGSRPSASTRNADLLLGALRERVAQVGRAEVVGDRLEPVVGPSPERARASHSGELPSATRSRRRGAVVASSTRRRITNRGRAPRHRSAHDRLVSPWRRPSWADGRLTSSGRGARRPP